MPKVPTVGSKEISKNSVYTYLKMAKTIAVFGATGLQGGAVARALLKESGYAVRAVTRNPDSDKAKVLKQLGAEVVKADTNDKPSVVAAMSGCYGVYGVTNFWEHADMDREITQGKTLVDAAKDAGIKHFVYSTLANVKALIGKPCPHFDGKALVEEYMAESAGVPYTCVRFSAYMENFLDALKPVAVSDNVRLLNIPMGDTPWELVCMPDAATSIAAIFNKPSEYVGKRVILISESITLKKCAEILSRHFSPLVFEASDITPDKFAKLGFPGAEDLAAMFEFYQAEDPATRDYIDSRGPDLPKSTTFEQWVIANREALKSAFA